jgi:uncharacterized protein YigE (DUF2233 family)
MVTNRRKGQRGSRLRGRRSGRSEIAYARDHAGLYNSSGVGPQPHRWVLPVPQQPDALGTSMTTRSRTRTLAAALLLIASCGSGDAAPVGDVPCRAVPFESAIYTVCSFDLAKADLRLFWKKAGGGAYASFSALAEDLRSRGLKLTFGMNAGMYKDDLSPVGLYIENGEELRKLNTADVRTRPAPNFYKKPNGVFYLEHGHAGILETGAYQTLRPNVEFATQSGPMLLVHGELHPAFIKDSSDRKRRNGVGLTSATEVHFVIADAPVNFYDFARFFRDGLGCREALFLDGGSASGLYAPELGRSDWPPWEGYGPIVGAVEK